jgi:methyl-accepting chemotaxis protein
MFKSLNAKLVTALLLMTVLALVCGVAGIYGVQSLSNSLDFITGKAWNAADGAMETTIGIQSEMLAVNAKTSGETESKTERKLEGGKSLEESEKFTKQAYDRLLACGLLSQKEHDELMSKYKNFQGAREKLLAAHADFTSKNDALMTAFDSFQNFMIVAENFGDGQVDELENTPDKAISWKTGLKEKWDDANNAMEAQIHLLERNYYYKLLLENGNSEKAMKALERSIVALDASIVEISKSAAFASKVAEGEFAGSKYADVFVKLLKTHKTTFTDAIAALQSVRQSRASYIGIADDLQGYMSVIEEVGDSKVEGESENLAQTKWISRTFIAGALFFSLLMIGLTAFFSYSRVVKPLNNMVASTTQAATQFSSSSTQVAASGQQLAESTSEQASSLEETASALEELSNMTEKNSEHATEAMRLAAQARASAQKGDSAISGMNASMDEIKKSSDEVAKIISTIEEIAFQTNILSLNAAVEAARAGDAGRSFAVVADEVRQLAHRCATATQESAQKIETAARKTEQGLLNARNVTGALLEINESVGKVTHLVEEIAAASQQQAQGIQQVNSAVQQMDKVVQSNAAGAEETASAAEEMSAQAEELRDSAALLASLAGVAVESEKSSVLRSKLHVPVIKTNISVAHNAQPTLRADSFKEFAPSAAETRDSSKN